MSNSVKQYELKKPLVFHAVLWQGKAEDLIGMPDFNRLVTHIISIDGTGLLTIESDGLQIKVFSGQEYLVSSPEDGLYVCGKKEFEEEFQVIPEVGRAWER